MKETKKKPSSNDGFNNYTNAMNNVDPIIEQEANKTQEQSTEKEEKKTDLEFNCYILTPPIPYLPKSKLPNPEKAVFDPHFGWCFLLKEDAEKVAINECKSKLSKVQIFYRDSVEAYMNGSPTEKKAVKKRTALEINKKKVEEREKKLQIELELSGFDKSFLEDEVASDDLNAKQRAAHARLRPEYEKILKEKAKLFEDERSVEDLEEKALKAKEERVSNPLDLPFKILGYNNKREVILWHEGQIMPIQVKQLGELDIKLLIGEAVNNENWKYYQSKIIEIAHEKGKIYDEKPIKSGISKLKDKWIVVSGKRAVLIKDNQLIILDQPIIDNRIIELDGKDWINWDVFINEFGKSDIKQLFSWVCKRVKTWNWKEESMAEYAAAFILLAPVQQALSWRPWVYLTVSKCSG